MNIILPRKLSRRGSANRRAEAPSSVRRIPNPDATTFRCRYCATALPHQQYAAHLLASHPDQL